MVGEGGGGVAGRGIRCCVTGVGFRHDGLLFVRAHPMTPVAVLVLTPRYFSGREAWLR
jgi:hypothetical protein